MRPGQRLHSPKEFQAAYRQGRKFGNTLLTAAVRENGGPVARLGMSIAARTVGNAVQRNRLRRLIREGFRLAQHELPAVDIVVGARPHARQADATQAREAIRKLWTQIIAAWPRPSSAS